METSILKNTVSLFEYYRSLGEKAMVQVADTSLWWTPDEKSNSISLVVKHLHGNMLSRWTDFLTTDGEKEWRNRDDEFVESIRSRSEMMKLWDDGWNCVFNTLHQLSDDDLAKVVYIRNMGHTVHDAIMRQLAHYAYHIGQIVYLARLANDGSWTSLSIPKGSSSAFNREQFEQGKRMEHFTDGSKSA